MCGIAGGVGSLGEDTLLKMIKVVSHRGPDYLSTEIIDDVHLAHSRLSIIDLSIASNQPLWDITNSACIVFNGEIYNYKELRNKLESKGYIFNSKGDAEVLLNLYLEYSNDLFEHLNGIFSFAIWDNKKKELFLARDHFGVKPLYYFCGEQGFYFASEIKSLIQIPFLQRKINYDALLRTLVFLWSPGEETLLTGVKKVKPGHYLTIKDGNLNKSVCYWQWPKYKGTLTSANEAEQEILNSLQESVSAQMVSDVPLGSFLSGGLDSSLLVAIAKEKFKKDLKCFTIDSVDEKGNNDGFADDLPYAKMVAEHLSVPLNVLKVSPDIVSLLPKMIYHLDELQADPAPINVMLICEEAKRNGIKVLLSGAGGDDIFTGYRRHIAIRIEKYWAWLPKQIRCWLKKITGLLPKNKSFSRRFAKAFKYSDLSSNERLLSYFYWLDPIIARDLFTDEIKAKLSDSPMGFILDELDSLKEKDPVEKMLHLERSYFLVDHNFNYTDKMSMACGVEVRVPFLDKKVVETAARVNVNLKQKNTVGKWILKKVGERFLPKNIIYRSKSGFGAPLRSWLKGDLADSVDKYLSEEKIKNRGIFKAEKIKKIIDDDRSGKEDYSYSIFAILCFEIWCEVYLDEDVSSINNKEFYIDNLKVTAGLN